MSQKVYIISIEGKRGDHSLPNKESCGNFQDQVAKLLLRHRSILDSLTKFQESNARVNRAIIKSVTTCGCLEISAEKQPFPPDASIEECSEHLKTHVSGDLCESCREVLESEIGNHLFYMAALANLLDISIDEAIIKESDKISTLGYFNLS